MTEKPSSLADLILGGGSSLKPGERLQEILVADIRTNPFQVRKTFDENTIKELAMSVEKSGLLQPVVVREIPGATVAPGPKYELIAGERRLRAHKFLGREKIPSIVKKLEDHQLRLLALLENLQREDLSITERSHGFIAFMKESGLNGKDAGEKLGISERTVRRYIKNTRNGHHPGATVAPGRLSFGQRVRELEKAVSKKKPLELSEKDKARLLSEAERFFKAIGAKKVVVRF